MITAKILKIESLKIDGLSEDQCLKISNTLEAELKSWEATKYWPEMQMKGRGVDCVRYLAAILDLLTGVDHDISTLPQDAALHNPKAASSSMRKILECYPSTKMIEDTVQPGDIIICGPVNGGPGHGMIVGKKTLWHCGSFSVCRAGLSFGIHGNDNFKEVRRLKDRDTWTRIL